MTDRRTFEDELLERGWEPPFEPVECPGCKDRVQPFALVDVEDLAAVPGKVRCGHCIDSALNRVAIAEPEPEGWESDCGSGLKAKRNTLLDRHSWTVRPDSPLSAACQAEWLVWLKKLHRMTVDHTLEEWVWPEEPELQYKGVAIHGGG